MYILIRNFYDFMDILGEIPSLKKSKRGKLRILIFNWRDKKHVWAGGAEVYVQEIGKQWAKDGHSVTIFCGWDGNGSRNDTIDGVNVIRRGGFYTVYPFALIYYLLKLRGKYDVVLDCENGIPFFTPFFSDAPIVLLIHHIHQDVFRKHLKFPFSFIAQQLEKNLMPFLYKNLPTVTVSESSKKDIINVGWGREENIHIVNPGIDEKKFGRGEKTAYPSLVYFGRLQPYKNIDVAINAFEKVLSVHPEAKLNIAGDGGQLESLKKLAGNLGISDSVIFHGRVDDETRKKILAESWAAIQPSSYEGWGITVLEANACGTPVIASNTKGLIDSVKDNETGLLFRVGDVKDLESKILTLLSNTNLRNEMSVNAHNWSQNFRWGVGANKFLNVIINDLSKRKRKIYIERPALAEEKG
jgi:glycosyltransferase involved in cell wall biosynthesis